MTANLNPHEQAQRLILNPPALLFCIEIIWLFDYLIVPFSIVDRLLELKY